MTRDGSDSDKQGSDASAALAFASHRFAADPDATAAELRDRLARFGGDWTPRDRARVQARSGQLLVFLGDLAGAEKVLRAGLSEVADDGYLALQLANVLAWRDRTEERSEAATLADAAAAVARRERDGPLALAAACLHGELALNQGLADAAIEAYGRALGIAEYARSDLWSVAPLAGLARSHLAWRNPRRARPLAERALARARQVGDLAGSARARAVLALSQWAADRADRDRAGSDRTSDDSPGDALSTALHAAVDADRAPHRPLALRIRADAAHFAAGDPRAPSAEELKRSAERYGMRLRSPSPSDR